MTYLQFILKSAIFDFSRNKGRTFLTSLGILIGVMSVVLLTAFGLGLKEYIRQQFESLGTNLIYIMPGNITGGLAAASGIGGIKFTANDVKSVSKVPGIEVALPMAVQMSQVQGETDTKTYEVVGSSADIFSAMNLEIDLGDKYTKADLTKNAKVAVIGSKVATEVFSSADNALRKNIKIDSISYKVIGIAKSKGGGGLGGPSIDEHIYIPYTAAASYIEDKKFYAIYAVVTSETSIPEVKDAVKKVLLKEYKEDKFSVADQTEILSVIGSIFSILNSILVAIAAISLLVGGIGIMNIMYVTVTERIREIGIRRAIGATRLDILSQFMIESVILSVFGGLTGLFLAFLITLGVQKIFPAYIDWQSVILALGVSSTIGIIFGVLPARKAAALSPIEAIRYE